jgi:hypothetical protein
MPSVFSPLFIVAFGPFITVGLLLVLAWLLSSTAERFWIVFIVQ